MRLTKTAIDAAEPAAHDTYLWCAEMPGFGVRIKPSGVKSFVIQYRTPEGRSRRLVLGKYGRLTLQEARKAARVRFGEIARGLDPLAERERSRQALTVDELADRYLERHARVKKKPRSVKTDESNLNLHVRPALGHRKVTDVTRAHMSKLHYDMRETPGAANRVLALCSKMFNLAEGWGLRPDGTNPCRHIERYKENRRERFLSEEELARLGAALDAAEVARSHHPCVVPLIRLLVFTGCRLGEVLNLEWDHVDLERSVLSLPDSKTGAKTVVLNAPALDVLRGLPPDGRWVLPGHKTNNHISNPHRAWNEIRNAAGLSGVRLHDLRHSFASVGAGAGASLALIGGLLGHRNVATTARYAHLSDSPLRQLSETIGQRIEQAMGSKSKPTPKPGRGSEAESLH